MTDRVTLTVTLPEGWRDAARPGEDAAKYLSRMVRANSGASVRVKRRGVRPGREAFDHVAALRRQLAAVAARSATGDLDPLVGLHQLARDLDAAMTRSAVAARAAGHTWTTIGAELGMTRQGARQRWGPAAAAAGVGESVGA